MPLTSSKSVPFPPVLGIDPMTSSIQAVYHRATFLAYSASSVAEITGLHHQARLNYFILTIILHRPNGITLPPTSFLQGEDEVQGEK